MPRNRFTRLVRKEEQRQRVRQERELIEIEKRLRTDVAESGNPPLIDLASAPPRALSRRHTKQRRVRTSTAAAAMLLLAGCGVQLSSPPEVLAENQRILASCDTAHPPAAWVALDGTSSSATEHLADERMRAAEAVARRTAVCSGRLKVMVFSSSSTATATLFDGSLRQAGATDNARLRRVPDAVAETMAIVRKAYGPAAKRLDGRASDIVAQFRLAREWQRQLGGSYRLQLYVLTDGFQTAGGTLRAELGDHDRAKQLAHRPAVPKLSGASVTVAGLGRVAGTQPSSAVVEGLVTYYDTLCHRMDAASCLAVSDFQEAGW